MKKAILNLIAVSLLLNSCTYNAPAWFTDRGSLAHTASVNEEVTLPLNLRWNKNLNGAISGPAIGASNFVVVGAGNVLYALDPTTGATKWQYQNNTNYITSATAFQKNKGEINYVVISDFKGDLHCVNSANGSSVWKLNDGLGSYISSSVLATNMIFYTKMKSGSGSILRAVRAETGELVWEKSLGYIITSTPMHAYGRIFYGNNTTTPEPLIGYNFSTGNNEWKYFDKGSDLYHFNVGIPYTNGVFDYDVELNESSRLYFSLGTTPASVKALKYPTQNELWSTNLPINEFVTGFALTQTRPEKRLIVTQSSKIYSIDPLNGNILWEKQIARNEMQQGTNRHPQPLIWGDYVFHVVGNNTLKAYSLADGQEKWSYEISTTYCSPIAGGKTLYIGNEAGNFYAFSY